MGLFIYNEGFACAIRSTITSLDLTNSSNFSYVLISSLIIVKLYKPLKHSILSVVISNTVIKD